MSNTTDFYFSKLALYSNSPIDNGYNEVFIDGKWIPFTEQIDSGKKPLSVWKDLKYIGQTDGSSKYLRWVKLKNSNYMDLKGEK